jgi:hypothetical protein
MEVAGPLAQTPFSFLVVRSSVVDRVAQYVLREHERGRPLVEVLEDRYVQTRLSPRQRRRLLDRPEFVHALGSGGVSRPRAPMTSAR